MGLLDIFKKKKLPENNKKSSENNFDMTVIDVAGTARINFPIYAKQINESMEIIRTTINPETFFYRYGFIIERLTQMQEMQRYINAKCNALEVQQAIINDKDKYIACLISRMFEKTKEKISTLKHQNAIENNIDNFLSSVEGFSDEMGEQSKKYFEEVRKYLKTKYLNNTSEIIKIETVIAKNEIKEEIQSQPVSEENYNYGSYLANKFKEIYKVTEKSYPNCNGLKISEITKILEKISYSGMVTIKNSQDYPKWFDYEFSIEDPYKTICKLRDDGYLHNCSPEIILKKLKVSELKEELLRQGLSVSGKKADLISRLLNESESLSSFLPEIIEISDKGKKFLEDNSESQQEHLLRNYGLNIEQFQSFKNKNPDSDFYSIVIQILTEQDAILAEKNEISMSRVKKSDIAMALKQKGDKKMALQYYIFSAYYSLCELIESFTDVKYEIDGFLALKINELKDYYSDLMVDNCYKWSIGGYYKKPDDNNFRKEIIKLIR